MKFVAESYIEDVSDMSFFIAQLNTHGIAPKVMGRRIYETLTDVALDEISFVLGTFENIPDKADKNEFSFTIIS